MTLTRSLYVIVFAILIWYHLCYTLFSKHFVFWIGSFFTWKGQSYSLLWSYVSVRFICMHAVRFVSSLNISIGFIFTAWQSCQAMVLGNLQCQVIMLILDIVWQWLCCSRSGMDGLFFSSPEPKADIHRSLAVPVRQHFHTTSPLKPWNWFLPNFIYSIFRQGERMILFFVPIV